MKNWKDWAVLFFVLVGASIVASVINTEIQWRQLKGRMDETQTKEG